VKNRPILMKFSTLHQILNPVTSRDQKLKFLKFKMAAATMLKIAFLAITHQPIFGFQQKKYEEAKRNADKGYGTKNANV